MIDGLTRAWNEWVAALAEPLWGGAPTLFVMTVVAAAIAGVLWAYWPAWLPWHWRWSRSSKAPRRRRDHEDRLGRPRLRLRWRLWWRRSRRTRTPPAEREPLADDRIPDLPSQVLAVSADELAAAGRYAEAVRERLRSMIRGLIERDLLPASPGWTVMELARAGGRNRPELAASLDAAAAIFSDIWYGLRPATADDDAAMREHAAAVAALVAAEPVPAGTAQGRPQ